MKKHTLSTKKATKLSSVKKTSTFAAKPKSALKSNTLMYSLAAVVVVAIALLGLVMANMNTSTESRSQAANNRFQFAEGEYVRYRRSLGEVKENGVLGGWVVDSKNPNKELTVAAYIGGTRGRGEHLGTIKTTVFRPDVNEKFDIKGNHGFRFQLPAKYQDGKTHNLFLYVVEGKGDGNVQDVAQTYQILSDAPYAVKWKLGPVEVPSGSTLD